MVPHTIQPIQIINQKPVVFNIGNAVFNSDGEYEQQNALPFGCIARLDLAKRYHSPLPHLHQ